MNNPFTTIQDWIDKRRAKKNQEKYGGLMNNVKLAPEFNEIMADTVLSLRSTGPKIGDTSDFSYYGIQYRVEVIDASYDQIRVSVSDITDIQSLTFDKGGVLDSSEPKLVHHKKEAPEVVLTEKQWKGLSE